MTYLDREHLSSDKEGQLILQTVDGPIHSYMAQLMRNKKDALSIMDKEFSSLSSSLYSKGKASGFNIHRNRLKSIIINAFLSLTAYQQTARPNTTEYQTLSNIVNAFEYTWQNPIKSLRNQDGLKSIYSEFNQWIKIHQFTGDQERAIEFIQSAYLLIAVSKLNINSINSFYKVFIPGNFIALLNQTSSLINERYYVLINADLKSHPKNEYDGSLSSEVNGVIDELRQSRQKNLIALEEITAKFYDLGHAIEDMRTSGKPFWTLFENKTAFVKFINQLNLNKSDFKKWKKQYKYQKKKQAGQRTFYLKSYSYLNDDYITYFLNKKAHDFCNLHFKQLIHRVRDEKDGVSRFDKLSQIIKNNNDTAKLELTKQQLLKYVKIIEELAELSLIKDKEQIGGIEEKLQSSNTAFIEKRYLFNKAERNLNEFSIEAQSMIAKLAVINNAFKKMQLILDQIDCKNTIRQLDASFHKFLIKSQNELLPDEAKIESINASEILTNIITYYQKNLLSIHQQIRRINEIIDGIDLNTKVRAMIELKAELESPEHKSFWSFFVSKVSPSYAKCLQLCEYHLSGCDFDDHVQVAETLILLREDMMRDCSEFVWWDIGQDYTQSLSTHFSQFSFFRPLPAVNLQEKGVEPTVNVDEPILVI